MSPRVTIREVAVQAGVSVTTASRALNGEGRMMPETRNRVREAAKALGYRPNSIARGLVQQRSFTVGLLTNDTYGRFTLPVAAGLSAAMVDRGVSVFLASTQDDPALAKLNLSALEDKLVDGLVFANRRIDRGLDIDSVATNIPTVHVMASCPEGGIGFIPDDLGGAVLATEHLVKNGRKRIAHITGPDDFASTRYRTDGWLAALQAAGLEPWGQAIKGQWTEMHGFETALSVFGSSPSERMPDAVFCGNDQIARGLIDALIHLGLRVPEDVAVIGFDNWEIFAAATRPPLTTIDMNLMELGRHAAHALLDKIDGKPVEPGVRRLPCSLVVRQSCGAERPAAAA